MQVVKRINKAKLHQIFNKKAVLVMIGVYVALTLVAIFGRIMLNRVLQAYADERMGRWVESILNEAPLLATADAVDETFPGSLENISYKIYQGAYGDGSVIFEANIDEKLYRSDAVRKFYQECFSDDCDECFKYTSVQTSTGNLIVVYMHKQVVDNEYTFCGYIPDEIFLHNPYVEKIILVYSIISSMMVALLISMAGFFTKYERVRQENQYEIALRNSAEQSAKAQSEFLTKMSHEFRTPLNAILGMNEMIRREAPNNKVQEYAIQIETAGQSLLSMVNEILDFAKLDAHKIEIINNEYRIADMIAEIKHMIELQAQRKGLDFFINIDEDLPVTLVGDYTRIKQIIINLCNNAVKYTEQGNVTLSINWIPDATMQIIVSDTGIGIKEEDIPLLFGEFSRVDLNRTQTIEGTGLGLAIVQKFTSMMNGLVRVESVYGKGSSFIITIPQCAASDNHYIESTLAPGETFVAPKLNVLLVDDTQTNLDVLMHLLAHTQMNIITALSGAEALHILQEQQFDLIFLDERMPEMSGFETYEQMQMQDLNNTAKIVMLTANANNDDKARALGMGFAKYIVKPVPAHILESIIFELADPDKVSKIARPVQTGMLPEWVMNHPDITTAIGLEACGTPADYLEALSNFAEYAPMKLNELKDYVLNGDFENFTIKVHALKSSARMVGLLQLSQKAEEFENAGERKDFAFISMRIPELLGMYGELTDEIGVRLRRGDADAHDVEKDVIDANAVYGILNHLRGYVMDFNDEAVNSMIHALSHYDFPDDVQAKFEQFKTAFANVSWIEMQEIIDELVEQTKQWQ